MSRHGKLLTGMLCAIAIIGVAVAAVPAQDQPSAADESATTAAPEITALQAEIQAMREQIAQLEERLAALEGGIRPLEYQFTPDIGRGPRRAVPPAIQDRAPQGEINGIPYYVIPLRETPYDVIPMRDE